ncbi:MAG: PorV/PorQ family protein [Candidatus Eisenbacteria sp.]|nr:PorV/PorQ family protein [Candidatus Eisenbacteria bacterium]
MRRLSAWIVIVLLGICATCGEVMAVDNTGTAGALFLRLGYGPRQVGMGGAAVATPGGGAASVFWNAAGLAQMWQRSVWLCDTEYIAGIRVTSFAYAQAVDRLGGTVALSVISLSSGSMQVTTANEINGVASGEEFSWSDLAIGISYARNLTDRFSVGGTAKYIREGVGSISAIGYSGSAQGVAFDFGTLYHTGFRSLRFGVSATNFGPSLTFGGDYLDKYYVGSAQVADSKSLGDYDLPLMFQAGIAYDPMMSSSQKLTVAMDFTHPNDAPERLHVGTEYVLRRVLALRAGGILNWEGRGPFFGIGLNIPGRIRGDLRLDYAYSGVEALEDIHQLSIAYSW